MTHILRPFLYSFLFPLSRVKATICWIVANALHTAVNSTRLNTRPLGKHELLSSGQCVNYQVNTAPVSEARHWACSNHPWIHFHLRCMPVRLNVDVTCHLPQGQSNETLMDICEEQRFEDIDVVMRVGKPRGCPDANRKRMTLSAHRHNLAAGGAQ